MTSIASEGRITAKQYEVVSADPVAISKLVKSWEKQRPDNMQGIIWYRLPVDTDRMNWTWSTLQLVRQGLAPEATSLTFSTKVNSNNIHIITATNNSTQNIEWPQNLKLQWNGFCIAHQTSQQYSLKKIIHSSQAELAWNKNTPHPVAPGQSIQIGAFRFHSENPSLTVLTP